MKNRTIIILIILAVLNVGLGSFILYSLKRVPYALPTTEYKFQYIIGYILIPLSSLIIIPLIIIPALFRSSYLNWKSNNSSWGWQLLASLFIPIFSFISLIFMLHTSYLKGFHHNYPAWFELWLGFLGYFIMFFPFSLLISSSVTLIMAARVNARSSFFWALIGVTIFSLVFVVLWFFILVLIGIAGWGIK